MSDDNVTDIHPLINPSDDVKKAGEAMFKSRRQTYGDNTCVKTGALCYMEQHDCWVWGDVFEYIDRVCIVRFRGEKYRTKPEDLDVWVTFHDYSDEWPTEDVNTVVSCDYTMHKQLQFIDGRYQEIVINERVTPV